MKDCQCSIESLLEFLLKKQKDPSKKCTKEMVRHTQKCDSCRKILENETLACSFLKFYDAQITSASFTERSTKVNYQPDRGQIIKFNFALNSLSAFAVIDKVFCESTEFNKIDKIRIFPIFLAPLDEELTPEDFKIKAKNNPLNLPILIEVWNPVFIALTQVISLIGSLNEQQLRSLKEKRISQEQFLDSNDTVNAFRESEISKACYYNCFQITLYEEKSFQIPTEYTGNNLVRFNLLRQKNSFTSFLPEQFLGNETLPALAADTGSDHKNYVDRLHKFLCFIVMRHNLALRIRKLPKNKIQILNMNEHEFELIVQGQKEILCEKQSKNYLIELNSYIVKKIMINGLKELTIIETNTKNEE